MFFKLIKDLPWMFTIAFVIWLIVLIIIVRRPAKQPNSSFFKKNKAIVFAILLSIVFTVIDIWYFVEYAPTHFRRDISNEKSIALTATDIVNEFKTNETAAYAKYNNKAVEITGEVDKVDADSTSQTVIIKTTIEGSSVSARLKNKQDVTKGNTVTIKGIVTGFILDQVQLSEAIITNHSMASNPLPAIVSKDTAIVSKPIKDTVKTVAVKKIESKTYSTNKASVRFFSSTPEEDIEATNSQTISTLNDKSGQLNFASLIKGFHFENELMQDHFNSADYMNSDAFPKSEFKGTVTNISAVNFSKDGSYNVTATGNLTIHGVTKKINVTATITVAQGKVSAKAVFKIKRIDYGITTNEIADTLEITVSCKYD